MNKLLFLTSIIVMLVCISSCGNDILEETNHDSAMRAEEKEPGVFSFKDEQEFQEVLSVLEPLSTSERKEWVLTHKGYIKTLQDIYDYAMSDAANLDETLQSYLQYKEKYKDYLFFATYKDDCGVYLPVSNSTMAVLLNRYGEVMIGGEIVNKKDIHSYTQLQELGVAMYDMPETRATPKWGNSLISHTVTLFEEKGVNRKNVGQEFDSGWWVNNKRKIRFKCGRVATIIDYKFRKVKFELHVEISFRKSTYLGWANYSSKTETDANFWGGLNGSFHWYKHADSSHDFYEDLIIPRDVKFDNSLGYVQYTNPAISGEAEISFRGISYLDKLYFSIPDLDLNAGTVKP